MNVLSKSEDDRLTSIKSVLKIDSINRTNHQNRKFTCSVTQQNTEINAKTTSSSVNVLYGPQNMKIISNPTGSIFMEKTAASLECTGMSTYK